MDSILNPFPCRHSYSHKCGHQPLAKATKRDCRDIAESMWGFEGSLTVID